MSVSGTVTDQGRLPLFPGPVTCNFRGPKVNSYWLNMKAVGYHHGLHSVEIISILLIISRAHQPNLHPLISPFLFRPLPISKMVKIAVAGGSGRTSLSTQNTTINHADFKSTEVGQEVIDALVAAREHDIVILSRNVM